MSDEKNVTVNQTETQEAVKTENEGLGEIRISSEVVSIIASNAAMEVKGVSSLSGGIAGNISQVLGRKNPFKGGIKVEMGDNNEVNIDLNVVVEYGARIPDVAWKLQERVKQSVESMTGLHVNEINVHVQGVSFEKETKKAEPETQDAEKDVK
ncbi:hypothetical protein Cst_c07880 [Thermoclostridium stercorarium subsp. stercorarium DSM 8532]|uniref:Alkaline-shock protein n=3 Tax=Thermoclostridium stercorarium TaxID=1510 RepID=L7VM21_THES1|nr:Asp23/Gls24 family envelope stress response protein [Thermoclostridium stercorarium]AGC67792.1 hypothetical protein Cst_c07880 [Thermoclostridium stercorarium subsp. stercorarium DSM 8532]AGI38836.1 hypothetical protein Clst_0752 [Thermoclostridium stercorarium subsp. stercorarium DSM 8532]ANW98196.1 alkaline-shock protein [Thermoclostridium stercorarium subsp. thermolacticum DSM 2910]ANX00737.1 alkaline-shock protein [Thermoclostridium stercorarium subsp. leptospartum DSM 9219]UZQ86353.1 A